MRTFQVYDCDGEVVALFKTSNEDVTEDDIIRTFEKHAQKSENALYDVEIELLSYGVYRVYVDEIYLEFVP